MPDWSGKTIGKVHVNGLIARGGMAEVYLGEHSTLGRKVAVKIMRSHVDQDPETVERFEREAHVVASLRHPNIVQMYDFELADGQPCLIMEHISGPSLAAYLKALHRRGERLPLPMVSRLLRLLANAIDYAHSQHIVHRDIKPANVLLRSPGGIIDLEKPLPQDVEPILTDFGLVRLLDSSIQTSTGTVSGTPTYMSPEQARGDKVGPFTDIYSLGVILYEMLSGTVPFEADSTFGVLMKHLNEPPPPVPGISTDLQAVVDRALAKDSALRYSSAKELADEFAAVFNGQTVSPATIRLAQQVKKSMHSAGDGEGKQVKWGWIAAGIMAAFTLAFAGLQFGPAIFGGASAVNQPVGQVRYVDFNFILDKATITLTGLKLPEPGMHYEGWYLAAGGEQRQNAGAIEMDDSGRGQLAFTDSQQRNLLEVFDQFEVTEEPDNDPNPDQPSAQVIASFIYPPLAFIHIRHLLVRYDEAPNGMALIQGLWGTADGIDTSVSELQAAFVDGNDALVRQKTEEVINQLVGSSDTEQFRDWDKNGTIAAPGDGYGLLNGYLVQSDLHAGFASQAADATVHIRSESQQIRVCLDNVQGWSQQLLEDALQLQQAPFSPDMGTQIENMVFLSNNVLVGIDSNNNGVVEPIPGEGGVSTAYEHAYDLADMDLLPGPGRIPAPAGSANQ